MLPRAIPENSRLIAPIKPLACLSTFSSISKEILSGNCMFDYLLRLVVVKYGYSFGLCADGISICIAINSNFIHFLIYCAASPSQPTQHKTESRTEQRRHNAANTRWAMRQSVYPAMRATAPTQ